MSKKIPSADEWLREAKRAPDAEKCGMYLFHNGVVRISAKAKVRNGDADAPDVTGMRFGYDSDKVRAAIREAEQMDGIFYVRVWLNEGVLSVGDDLMLVLIGGDIRPRVIDCLQTLVGRLKSECVTETEISGPIE